MLWRKRGLAAVLLSVVLTGVSGCAKEGTLYTAGLTVQTETAAEKNQTAQTETIAEKNQTAQTEINAGESQTAQTETAAEDTFARTETETEAVLGYVYVCGAVNAPGVYPIRGDMRVCDAIAQAGGFLAEADEEWLNQAAVVSDGQKLYVYSAEETDQLKASGISPEGMSDETPAAAGAAADESGSGENAALAENGEGDTGISDGKVNLNTATAEELMTLPGIGESKAAAILAYRSEHGSFASIEEIQNISGIKSGVFSKIKDLITV
ncbi:MAG: ComEA family DNA-binding protein [Lachnospiraceae bacterium]|nr:ComEA family DNA-binding protein [Lachnospiraceae bacterium]